MIYLPISIGNIIGTCHKSASTSLENEYRVPGIKPLTNLAVIELKKSHWKCSGLLRDPLVRLESAYNYFQYGQCGVFPNTQRYETIEHFIDSILNGHSDSHWLPQTEQLVLCDKFYDLESFPLQSTVNQFNHIEKINYRVDDLKQYYAGDYEFRGNTWQL